MTLLGRCSSGSRNKAQDRPYICAACQNSSERCRYMNFVALLTKELRLRLRRERTIWVIIAYILLMGSLGWVFINAANNTVNYAQGGLSSVGTNLYYMLSVLQLFLIIFISPAFTATVVNGEKERQTFDLLLCSRLSAFSLVSGKLLAG